MARSADSAPRDAPQETVAARRILVVDDNRDSATSLAALLQMSGHATREAYDGLEALEVAGVFRPDVVLLDIGLPRLNGYEVCRRLRQRSRGNDVFIVALSGWDQSGDHGQSQDAGFDRHLVKPVKLEELTKLLRDRGTAAPRTTSG